MAEVGTVAKLYIDDSAGASTDVSAYLDDSGFTEEIDALETTTYGDTKREYIAGLEDGSISLSGPWNVTLDGLLNGIRRRVVDFIYYPAGEAGVGGADATHPSYTGQCLITSYETSAPVDGRLDFSAELQQSGALTRATA